MLYLGIFRLKFGKLLSHLKSEAWNFSECKISCKAKASLNLGVKKPYLGLFELKFEENIVMFKIRTLKLVKYQIVTNSVNFDIAPAFSEGLGPGTAYKVCLNFPLQNIHIRNNINTCKWCFGWTNIFVFIKDS